ncbi:MAG TPA: CBS domain-containing protein [Myxococcota bacterium]|nr:CBS domain-containing protein [Myxococcota bacterium]
MLTVRQLLARKGTTVHHIAPDATVLDALRLMALHDVGALVVLERGELAGLVSERDYARKVILHGKHSDETRVAEIMDDKPVCVGSLHSIEDCMQLITDRRVRHLPVVENGQIAGLISIGDVVKAIIADRETTIEELHQYIRGER